MEGWYKIHRQLLSSPLWLSQPFTRGQAWVDLIGLANHEDGSIWVRGVKIQVKRGQVGWSEVRLAERWKWSRSKTRSFLKMLESEQQIEQQKGNVSSIISIQNYEMYQNNISKMNIKKTAEEHQKDTNKNDNNDKNQYLSIFGAFRTQFPGTKRGEEVEFRNFIKKNKPEIVHLLLPALEKEINHKNKLASQGKFVPIWKNLSTWIDKKSWEEEYPGDKSQINNLNTPSEWNG